MNKNRTAQVADLPKMNAAQLQALHQKLFGAEHAISNCQHLRRKIAWHLQAAKEGGLPESVRQHAIGVARQTELRSRITENLSRRRGAVPQDQTVTTKLAPGGSRLPMPGSLIIRRYKDRTIVVKVLDEGFEYDSRQFKSLSAIAGEITGTRWNGHAFFAPAKAARRAE